MEVQAPRINPPESISVWKIWDTVEGKFETVRWAGKSYSQWESYTLAVNSDGYGKYLLDKRTENPRYKFIEYKIRPDGPY